MPLAQFIFNESAPSSASTVASSNAVAGSQSNVAAGVASPLDDYQGIDVIAEITAVGGTLDVTVQISPDMGANFYDVIHFTQVLAGTSKIFAAPLSLATTTSITVAIGKNLSPLLGVGTVVNGAFADRARLVMVGGAGTSAGGTVKVIMTPQRPRATQY